MENLALSPTCQGPSRTPGVCDPAASNCAETTLNSKVKGAFERSEILIPNAEQFSSAGRAWVVNASVVDASISRSSVWLSTVLSPNSQRMVPENIRVPVLSTVRFQSSTSPALYPAVSKVASRFMTGNGGGPTTKGTVMVSSDSSPSPVALRARVTFESPSVIEMLEFTRTSVLDIAGT